MAIVRKDKLFAGYNGNLESVKIYDNAGTSTVQVTNGVFVVVEGLLAGERETKKARLAGATDSTKDVLLVHNAEVMNDERLNKLQDFRIFAGKVARAYRLYDGDIITLTTDLISGTCIVGDQLLVKANGLIGKPAVAGDVTGARVVFTVIEDAGFQLDTDMGAFAVQVSRQ